MADLQILLVLRPAEGGIITHITQHLIELSDDFTFSVACSPAQEKYFTKQNCRVHPVPLGGHVNPFTDYQTVRKLVKLLRKHKFSLVHAHGFKAALVARLACAFTRTPCLVTIHGDFAHAARSSLSEVYKFVERKIAPIASGYITVSVWLADELATTYKMPRSKITVIPNGIPWQKISAMASARADHEIIVGTVARLAEQKGVENFIRAASLVNKRFPGVRFIVVGDGPLREELQNLTASLSLNEVITFTGFVDNVYEVLTRMHIFAQPSLSEGQGITALEAMAAGCPVVASNTGGLAELINSGENGLLVAPGNVEELADCICKLLGDRQYAVKLANNAQKAAQNYDLASTSHKTKQLYHCILEGGRRI